MSVTSKVKLYATVQLKHALVMGRIDVLTYYKMLSRTNDIIDKKGIK